MQAESGAPGAPKVLPRRSDTPLHCPPSPILGLVPPRCRRVERYPSSIPYPFHLWLRQAGAAPCESQNAHPGRVPQFQPQDSMEITRSL
jgi:hypothetical protein